MQLLMAVGITLRGTTDKTLNWVASTNAWTSSEDINLLTGKVYEINGTTVLSATALGSGILSSSLTSVGSLNSLNAATPTFTGPFSSSGVSTFANRVDLQQMREAVIDVTPSTNTYTCNYSSGAVFFGTSAPSANFTVNLTNVPTDNAKAITVSIIITQGATGYVPGTFNIDGSGQTIKWIGGSAPTPTNGVGKIDIFNFTLIRRSSSWTVLANANLNY